MVVGCWLVDRVMVEGEKEGKQTRSADRVLYRGSIPEYDDDCSHASPTTTHAVKRSIILLQQYGMVYLAIFVCCHPTLFNSRLLSI